MINFEKLVKVLGGAAGCIIATAVTAVTTICANQLITNKASDDAYYRIVQDIYDPNECEVESDEETENEKK